MYTIAYHEEVKNDFKKLGHRTTLLIMKKIRHLAQNPQAGVDLGNKANLELAGYKKAYVDHKRVRIVYKVIDETITVFVVAVGKRDDMSVYKKAAQRT